MSKGGASMKRRGFLGLIGGAAVAGPSMAKQAIAASLGDTLLSQVGGGALRSGGDAGPAAPWVSDGGDSHWAVKRMAKLALRTAAQHAFHIRRQNISSLDTDLAANRSMALQMKVRLQREREYWRQLEGERGYLEAQIAGWFE